MLILAVDTSTRTGSLAVLRDRDTVAVAEISKTAPFSSGLFSELSKILSETGLSLEQFDLFAVCAGPGLFTGLRVGVTAVKAWAEVYRRPIAAVSALEAIAGRSAGSAKLVAPFFDGGRGQVFGGLYARGEGGMERLERLEQDAILSPVDFLRMIAAHAKGGEVDFVSTTPAALGDALRGSAFEGRGAQEISPILADAIGRLGYAQAARNEVVDAAALDANYIRRCDAEVLWKDPALKIAGV